MATIYLSQGLCLPFLAFKFGASSLARITMVGSREPIKIFNVRQQSHHVLEKLAERLLGIIDDGSLVADYRFRDLRIIAPQDVRA